MLDTVESLKQLVRGNTAFALDLYHHLRKPSSDNLFLSPYSISSCLGMVSLGARGDTALQLARCLRFGGESEETHVRFAALQEELLRYYRNPKIDVRIANRLWLDNRLPVLQEFLDRLDSDYHSAIEKIDFADAGRAAELINGWCREATNAVIDRIVGEEDVNGALFVLANAIYFSGKWSAPFKKKMTQDAPFYLAPRQVIQVPMMRQFAPGGYAKKRGLQVLEKAYGDGQFSMVILLPERLDGLEALETSLSLEYLEVLLADLEPMQEIEIYLPKFRIATRYELSGSLMEMGIVDAFRANTADFSSMTGSRGVVVSRVIHEAVIDVEEEGTEAAAVTATIDSFIGLSDCRVFHADHPFVFLIRHNHSGTILFLGRVVNPRSKP